MKTSKSENKIQKKTGLSSISILSTEEMLVVRGGNDDPETPIIRIKP